LAILVEDRDAPNGRFVHWTVWNINPAVTRIDQGSVPAGARVGMTDFGRPGYGGPCPPDGRHNYRFTVFALDQTLTLPMRATVAEFDRAIKNHIIGQAVLTASYKRVSYGL
jgi:Raf kinase inhibitor-like YbhB/YbcL family protein